MKMRLKNFVLWKRFKDLKIRSKLLFLTAVFVSGFSAVILTGYLMLNEVKIGGKLYNSIESYQVVLENMALLKAELSSFDSAVLAFRAEKDTDKIEQLMTKMKLISENIETYFSECAKISDDELNIMIKDAHMTWQEFINTNNDELLPESIAGNTERVEELYGIQNQRFRRFAEQVTSTVDILRMKVDGAKETAAHTIRKNIIFVGVMGAVTVVVMLLASLAFIKIIVSPLAEITSRARSIANGVLTHQRMEIESRDELGELKEAFNDMLFNLNRLLQKAELISNGAIGADELEEAMAKGMDFEKAAESLNSDAKGDLEESFNRMYSQLRKLTVQARLIAADDLNNPILESKMPGELAEAFAGMVSNLKGFAKTADNIAAGDLRSSSD